MPPPLPWTNTSPLIITHACRDVGLSIGAWIESQKRNWVSLSCESSIVCSFGTLSSFLSSSILAGLIFPWSCAATAPENSHVQTPCCVSETLCPYSLYLPWWFLGLRRSCDSDIRLCFLIYFFWDSSSLNSNFFPLWSEKGYLNFKACDRNILSTGTDHTGNFCPIYDFTSLRQIKQTKF